MINASRYKVAFLVPPVLFFAVPLKISLLVTICSVLTGLSTSPVFKRISPSLYGLAVRYLALYREQLAPFKNAIEFVEHMRPFIFWGLWLSAPLVPFIMFFDVVRRFLKVESADEKLVAYDDSSSSLRLLQNLPESTASSTENFISSPIFACSAIALFASGIPALVTYAIYALTGADQVFGYPSRDPNFVWLFGFVLLYSYSVGWCLSTLFFKAYYTFPLNFTSTERFVELDENGVRTSHIKGWFAQVLGFCEPDFWPAEISWQKVKTIEYYQAGVGKMYPLPDLKMPGGKSVHRILNRFAKLSDSIVERLQPASYITINEQPQGSYLLGKTIKVNLWELDKASRSNFFKAVKRWAPGVVFSDTAVKHLLDATEKSSWRFDDNHSETLLSDDECCDRFRAALPVLQQKQAHSLRRYVRENGPLSALQALQVARQMGELLERIHNSSLPTIGHGFTPDNLVLDKSNVLGILNQTRFPDEHPVSIRGYHRSYMAPELFRGQDCLQADIYAFGATVYFLISGEDPPPITRLGSAPASLNESRSLEFVIGRATALNLVDRYDDARWLSLDLATLQLDLDF